MLWRNAGVEEVALPLAGGSGPQAFSRDGGPLPARVAGDALRFGVGEAPVYVRQRSWPVVSRLLLPIVGR
jgi:hypothetical protein